MRTIVALYSEFKDFYMKYIILSLLYLAIGIFSDSHAQVLDPVKWSWEINATDNVDEFNLVFHANIEDKWKIYSQYLESDDGPVATSFTYESADHIELIGKNVEEGKIKKGFDELFGMNVISLEAPKASFTQKIRVKNYAKDISGYLSFMTCDATQCLPPTDVDFSFELSSLEIKQQKKKKTVINDSVVRESEAVKSGKKLNAKGDIVEHSKFDDQKHHSEYNYIASGDLQKFETDDPVIWSIQAHRLTEKQLVLEFTSEIDDNWTIYSQFTNDNGPVPTRFELEGEQAHTLLGKAKELGKQKKGYDPLFEVEVIKYAQSPVTFLQKVNIGGDQPVQGFLTYMACDDKQCLPPTPVDFMVNPVTLEAQIGDIGESSQGLAIKDESDKNGTRGGQIVNGNVLDQRIPTIFETQSNPVYDCGTSESTKDSNLFWTFVFGFLGGLLALLTPCVFPMIPLTVSYFTKGSKDRASGLRNGLIYGLSIIVIYVLIGLLITGVFGATALNELSTNWIANVLFFIIFIIFAISFFGYFEITLPSSWANASDRMADGGGLIGTFFMAFTLALVSFSCTGPIIGSALVQSATDSLGPFTVMLGFSAALALPFGLFAAFPAWLNSLPQSGGWMNTVKVILGFLELALALKFLSVADMTMHWGILKYELFMALWVIIFAAMALYAFGFIKFPHDSPIKKLSTGRWIVGIVASLITVYLATGFRVNSETHSYNSLVLMSGLAPPASYNYFLDGKKADENIKSKYASFTTCANNISCFKDYFEGLEYAKSVNKPVFLDFTGHGCVNCRKTEEHIWVDDRVKKHLSDDFVLISLYVDDRKKLEKRLVSKHTDKKMRNIGNRWADFQIVNFEQNSQPLYVMLSTDEKVIAHPRGYKEGIDDYLTYLECGLDNYQPK